MSLSLGIQTLLSDQTNLLLVSFRIVYLYMLIIPLVTCVVISSLCWYLSGFPTESLILSTIHNDRKKSAYSLLSSRI